MLLSVVFLIKFLRTQRRQLQRNSNKQGEFWEFFSMYRIQHCFKCRPSDSTVPEDAGIDPRTVATSALAVRRSNHSARSYPRLEQISSTTRLAQISSTDSARSLPQLGQISSTSEELPSQESSGFIIPQVHILSPSPLLPCTDLLLCSPLLQSTLLVRLHKIVNCFASLYRRQSISCILSLFFEIVCIEFFLGLPL